MPEGVRPDVGVLEVVVVVVGDDLVVVVVAAAAAAMIQRDSPAPRV